MNEDALLTPAVAPVSPPVERRIGRFRVGRQRIDLPLILADAIIVTAVLMFATTQQWELLEAIAFVLMLAAGGLYRPRITLSALAVMPRLVGFSLVGTIAVVVCFDSQTPILRAVGEALGVAVLLFITRLVYYTLQRRQRRRNTRMRSRTAILGGGTVASKILHSIYEHPELGLEPIIVVDQDPLTAIAEHGIAITSGEAGLHEIVTTNHIDTLIVAFSRTADSNFVSPLRGLDELDCEIFVVPRLFEFVHLTYEMDRIHTFPLVHVRRNAQRTWYWQAKRLFDFMMALAALVLVAPVMAATAAAVYLTDHRSPIIFRQQRIGRSGSPFDLYKFRSMKPVTAETSDVDWNPDRENRLGRVGKLIRKTSIDELPQLWNVLKGDMSIVGPRPERPHFVAQFETSVRLYQDRHRVNVGLTGWAAIHGLRGDTSIDDRADYDNFYIENWSVWLDIKIIILTVGALLRGSGS